MVLWDEKRDDELQAIVGKFIDAGIKVMDLTNGLAVLGVEEEGVEEAPDEEAPDEEEEDEGTDEAEAVAELEDEAVDTDLYTRAALEKMSHAQVKDIAVEKMGLAPRKARENMIVAILEAQGTEEAAEAPVVAQAVAVGSVDGVTATAFLAGFQGILDEFGERFMVGLDEWLTKFSTAAEGFAFNTNPEEPMPVEEEEPPQRRIIRR
jgi:hypothetical protein